MAINIVNSEVPLHGVCVAALDLSAIYSHREKFVELLLGQPKSRRGLDWDDINVVADNILLDGDRVAVLDPTALPSIRGEFVDRLLKPSKSRSLLVGGDFDDF